MRRVALFAGVSLLLWACTGEAASTTSSAETATSAVQPTAAPPTTTEASATTTGDISAIVLRHDGLGVVSFGESVDSVMATLTDMLGPPDWEEIQISADTDFSVRWGKDGEELLYLQFTYWDYFDAAPEPPGQMPEGPVFHYYLTKSKLFSTEAEVTVDTTVSELATAYPDLRITDNCAQDPASEFIVDPPASWLQLPIFGLLDGGTSTRQRPASSTWVLVGTALPVEFTRRQ